MGQIEGQERTYALKQPKNWTPPVPRHLLKFPSDVHHAYTLYLGVQSHTSHPRDAFPAEESIKSWLARPEDPPDVVDTFRVTAGYDVISSRVWVAYWTDGGAYDTRVRSLNLKRIWSELPVDRRNIGLWAERFTTPIDRIETNYARTFHKPGIARITGGKYVPHELTGYWGSARDRLPASAHDLFDKSTDHAYPSAAEVPDSIGGHLTGSNYADMAHIRSGQRWAECSKEERRAYEEKLEPTLMNGMRYLWEHAEETGTIGLRFLQNLDESEEQIRETCGAGFFRNWKDLEKWSSRHPSHLAIFNGAIKHAKDFGDERRFMTWHEVSILKEGEAHFEYVNCTPETGVIRWVKLDRQAL